MLFGRDVPTTCNDGVCPSARASRQAAQVIVEADRLLD